MTLAKLDYHPYPKYGLWWCCFYFGSDLIIAVKVAHNTAIWQWLSQCDNYRRPIVSLSHSSLIVHFCLIFTPRLTTCPVLIFSSQLRPHFPTVVNFLGSFSHDHVIFSSTFPPCFLQPPQLTHHMQAILPYSGRKSSFNKVYSIKKIPYWKKSCIIILFYFFHLKICSQQNVQNSLAPSMYNVPDHVHSSICHVHHVLLQVHSALSVFT